MPVCPAERSRQPGEKRQGRDRVDRREERRKILANLDQKRRHVSAFYLDMSDASSTSRVLATASPLRRFNECQSLPDVGLTIQRFNDSSTNGASSARQSWRCELGFPLTFVVTFERFHRALLSLAAPGDVKPPITPGSKNRCPIFLL
jgi:hypothetical protein